MAQLTIDISGRMGLSNSYFGDSDQAVATNNRNFNGVQGQMVDGFFNPFMRVGSLSPSVSTLGATTVTTESLAAPIGSVVYDQENSDLYLAERGNQIFHFDGLDDTSLLRDINLTSSVVHDIKIYMLNGTRKLFYVYTKGGKCEVGISSLPSGTNNGDWLKTTVSGAFENSTLSNYNFIRTADNGFAYLFQDNLVHKIDGTATGGTNGTVSANSLVFPVYFKLIDAIDFRGRMFMVVQQSSYDTIAGSSGANIVSPVGIYIWDRATTVASINDFIPVQGVVLVSTIFVSQNGNVRVFCVGANGLPQIREFNGNSFETIREFSVGAYPRYPDSLTVVGGLMIWMGWDGNLYAYGAPHNSPGGAEVLAKIGSMITTASQPAATMSPGVLHYGASNTFSVGSGYRSDRQGLTLCYSSGSNYYVKKFFPFDKGTINNNAQYALQGDAYTPVVPLPIMSTIKDINIHCLTGSTDGSTDSTVQGTLKIYFNGSSTAWATKSVTRKDINKGYYHIEVNKSYINSIQIEIEYPTNILLSDAYDYHPTYAIVTYYPSTDKA